MRSNRLIVAVLGVGSMWVSACYGTVDRSDGPKVVGERAALIAKKRDWLKGYDQHCNVCFDAFELCEKGAVDAAQRADCKTALDSCVRGGLVSTGEDAGAEGGGEDAGVASEDDASVGEDAGVSEDAGVDEPKDAGARDAGSSTGGRRDAGVGDAGSRDAGDEDAGVAADAGAGEDAGAEDAGVGLPGNVDDDKRKLFENIQVCLTQAHTCLDAQKPDVQQCVSALGTCVKAALKDSFQKVCTKQVGACVAEKASNAQLSSVKQLCQQDLGI